MRSKKHDTFGATLIGMAAITLAACAGQGATPSASESTTLPDAVAGSSFELAAGSQSKALGISRWSFENDTFRGFGEAAEPMAEFRTTRGSLTVTSILPDQGVLGLRDHSQDSFSELSLKYFDALKSDLSESIKDVQRDELTSSEDNLDKAQWIPHSCYYTYASCMAVGQDAMFAGQILDYDCDGWSDLCPGNTLLSIYL